MNKQIDIVKKSPSLTPRHEIPVEIKRELSEPEPKPLPPQEIRETTAEKVTETKVEIKPHMVITGPEPTGVEPTKSSPFVVGILIAIIVAMIGAIIYWFFVA